MINLKKLIRKFEKNSNFYESADYDETSTRVDFLNDFFQYLDGMLIMINYFLKITER